MANGDDSLIGDLYVDTLLTSAPSYRPILRRLQSWKQACRVTTTAFRWRGRRLLMGAGDDLLAGGTDNDARYWVAWVMIPIMFEDGDGQDIIGDQTVSTCCCSAMLR